MPESLNACHFDWRPYGGDLRVTPRNQKCHLARIVDARKKIIVDDSFVCGAEPESRGQLSERFKRHSLLRGDLRQGSQLGCSYFGFVKALLVDRGLLRRITIGGNVADPNVIILKYLGAASLLNHVVFGSGAPADDRLLVTPRRVREYPAGTASAFEALVVNEAVDRFQNWP